MGFNARGRHTLPGAEPVRHGDHPRGVILAGMTDLVTCTISDGIADVRLNRPDKLNGVTIPMLRALTDTARRLSKDHDVRAVILSGNGESFCAGLDFATVTKDRTAIPRGLAPRPWRKDGTNDFQEPAWAWRKVPVPVIAAVHGHCFGAGIQFALAADFRFTTPDAQWSVLEGKWGLIPDMTGTRTLSELVGVETAKRLTMTAARISGQEAHDLGLAGRVTGTPRDDARAFALELAQRSPDALAAAKRLFNEAPTASARRTFARERIEQVKLLTGRNAAIARKAGLARETPRFVARGMR